MVRVSRLLSPALFYQVSSIFSSGSVPRALCSFLVETLQVTEVLEIREELEADAKWPVICHSTGTRLRQLAAGRVDRVELLEQILARLRRDVPTAQLKPLALRARRSSPQPLWSSPLELRLFLLPRF